MNTEVPTSNTVRIIFILIFIGAVGVAIFLFGGSAEHTFHEKDINEDITNDEEEGPPRKEDTDLIDDEEPKKETGEESGSDGIINTSLKGIVYEFLGRPYERGPLGEEEGEQIYREDVFDCTTLVLVSTSKYNANGKSAEEMMKVANYYPAGVVSFESRLHFTTYRNKVSPLFEDITRQIGGDLTEQKKVLLNKDREGEGRLIDVDWEEEVVIEYIKTEAVQKITKNIPKEVGVAFIVDGDENMGLDVRHEGFVFNGSELVHASSQRGEVYKEDLLKFLESSNYSGVLFFRFPK